MRRGLFVAALVVLLVAPAGTATAIPGIQCGEVIIDDFILEKDLIDCPRDGLFVGAPNIEIDLNGHTIDGDHLGRWGINNEGGYNGIYIHGGTIKDFRAGVLIEEKGENDRISDITFSHNKVGLLVTESERNVVEANDFEHNEIGIAIEGEENVVRDNDLLSNESSIAVIGNENWVVRNGIEYVTESTERPPAIVLDGDRNTIKDNDVVAGGTGIDVVGSDNDILHNSLEDGARDGIYLDGSSNLLEENEVISYRRYGIVLIPDEPGGNVLRENEVTGSGADGILIQTHDVALEDNVSAGNAGEGIEIDGDDATLEENATTRNKGDGIQVDGDDAIVDMNEASENGGYGIRVDGKSARGSRNVASGNAATPECKPHEFCN